MTRDISLSQNKVALVDDEDYEALIQWTWTARKLGRTWYAKRSENYKTVFMHRFILNAPAGMEVDHIDGNGLNNTRSNLRLCTHADNLRNQRKPKNNTTGYKGVLRYGKNRFRALIYFKGRAIYLGYFDTPEEAARAYDDKATELYGEFASKNFPPQWRLRAR